MIELELEAKAIEELIELLSALPTRTNHLDVALLTLRDVYDNAAEDEAWAWRCRSVGCPGIMHTAGYARDRHGLVALCDACGTIALR